MRSAAARSAHQTSRLRQGRLLGRPRASDLHVHRMKMQTDGTSHSGGGAYAVLSSDMLRRSVRCGQCGGKGPVIHQYECERSSLPMLLRGSPQTRLVVSAARATPSVNRLQPPAPRSFSHAAKIAVGAPIAWGLRRATFGQSRSTPSRWSTGLWTRLVHVPESLEEQLLGMRLPCGALSARFDRGRGDQLAGLQAACSG